MESGLSAQVGYALEDTVGLLKPVTDFNGLIDEKVVREIATIKSNAIYANRRAERSENHGRGNESITGPIQHELTNVGLESLLTGLFGVPTKTGPVSSLYTRVYDARTLLGVALSCQGARPDVNGTVHPFSWAGCKITGAEIGLTVGEYATIGVDLVALSETLVRTVADGATTNASPTVTSATAAFTADDLHKPISGTGIPANSFVGVVDSATSVGLSSSHTANTPVNATATAAGVTFTIGVALASASYLSGIHAFSFAEGTITVGGLTPLNVKNAKIKIGNGLDTDRRGIGSRSISQPLEVETRTFQVELDCEFDGLAHYRRYIAQTEHAFSLVLDNESGTDSLTFTGNGYYEMPPEPAVSGPGIVRQTIGLNMVATPGGADSTAFQATLVNAIA